MNKSRSEKLSWTFGSSKKKEKEKINDQRDNKPWVWDFH